MKIDNDVLSVLSQATTKENTLTLVGQLDRKLYMKTDKVLDACGGKWNRKLKVHVFDGNAEDRIEEILLSGQVEIPKDEFNFFPTPQAIVSKLINAAHIKQGMTCLEPSAGHGAILKELVSATGDAKNTYFYELMESNFNHLSQNNLLGELKDFLSVEPRAEFDRVVMNPPFAKQADIKHVFHAQKFLKPGGLLVAVMSASVIFRENSLTKNFRDFVNKHDGHIISLPDGSFKESGTMVNTVMVIITA